MKKPVELLKGIFSSKATEKPSEATPQQPQSVEKAMADITKKYEEELENKRIKLEQSAQETKKAFEDLNTSLTSVNQEALTLLKRLELKAKLASLETTRMVAISAKETFAKLRKDRGEKFDPSSDERKIAKLEKDISEIKKQLGIA